jgi:hypothetical protein
MLRRSGDSQATLQQSLGPWEARLVDNRRFRLAERTVAFCRISAAAQLRCCRPTYTSTAFLMAILDDVLTENYCFFAGYYWKQFLGFATGVACGSEVANLFLFTLFEPVFSDPLFIKISYLRQALH